MEELYGGGVQRALVCARIDGEATNLNEMYEGAGVYVYVPARVACQSLAP